VVKLCVHWVDTLVVEKAACWTVCILANNQCNFSEKGQKMRAKSGFTLVEILIVVVILGILAAIVIPQFTEASTEAKTSSLATDLSSVRSQIQLYKIQHNDNLPGVANGTHTAGAAFVQAMTEGTDIFGEPNATGPYGPYLMKIPTNQFVDSDAIATGTVVPPAAPAIVTDGTQGWYFSTVSGDFWATDSAEHLLL
jgi:general secretion pathway protein G